MSDELKTFRKEVEDFLELSKMRPTVFSIRAAGDRMFLTRLRNGSNITMRTAGKVRSFIHRHAPRFQTR